MEEFYVLRNNHRTGWQSCGLFCHRNKEVAFLLNKSFWNLANVKLLLCVSVPIAALFEEVARRKKDVLSCRRKVFPKLICIFLQARQAGMSRPCCFRKLC